MTKVLNYPTDADRNRVHAFIGLYVQGKMTRNTMMYAIAAIIGKVPRLAAYPRQKLLSSNCPVLRPRTAPGNQHRERRAV